MNLMSLNELPMALILDDPQIAPHYEKGEKMHNPHNIDLVLECEDDQSYTLPRPSTISGGMQIHANKHVSMRISFSPPPIPQNLSCHYCQCNFLSETHLMDHMQHFHDENESGEEEGDDNVDVFQMDDDGHLFDNESTISGYAGLFSIRQNNSKEAKDTVVKTVATIPANMKVAMTAPANGIATAAVPRQSKDMSGFPFLLSQMSLTAPENKAAEPKLLKQKSLPKEMNFSPYLAPENAVAEPQTMKRKSLSSEVSSNSHLAPENAAAEPKITKRKCPSNEVSSSPPINPENGIPEPKSCKRKSLSTEMPPSPHQTTENGAAESKSLKNRSESMDANSTPRLTMTIKKSKSSYEIRREEHSMASVPPGMQIGEDNCDVQSDSTNETIDVESSSPNSSPNSVKNDTPSVISGRKKASSKFMCGQCGRGYVSKYALKRHAATHSEERPFLCTVPGCKGAFKLKSRLSDHLRYVHKQKTPRTGNRSKSVPGTTTSSLPQPVFPSAPDSPAPQSGKPSAKTKLLKCPVKNCNREFRDGFNLASHMCLHTGHMPFECPVSNCSFTAIQKTSLDWHLQKMHSVS